MPGHDLAATTEPHTNPGTNPGTNSAADPAADSGARHPNDHAGGVSGLDARLDVGLAAGLAPTISARAAPGLPDPRAAAHGHLRALRRASADLARALMATGYPPHRWQAPDPTLRELARDLPQPTLAALFARLDSFSGDAGPLWLASDDSSARAAFTREVHLLDDILRPLRALSLRRRSGAAPDHHARRLERPLERALAEPATAAPLDHLAHAADALVALAPVLAALPAQPAPRIVPVLAPRRSAPAPRRVPVFPLPSDATTPPDVAAPDAAIASPTGMGPEIESQGVSSAPSMPPDDAPTVVPADAPTIATIASAPPAASTDEPTIVPADLPTIPADAPFVPGALVSAAGVPGAAAGPHTLTPPPDAPTVPWLPRDATVPLPPDQLPRPRRGFWPLALPPLVTRLPLRLPPYLFRWRRTQLVVGLAVLACLACAVASIVLTFAPVAGPAAKDTPAGAATHTRALATATHAPPTPTTLPAQLAASPTMLRLACPFAGAPTTLTLRDTGGAALTWQIADPPLTLAFSATSGSLAPGASATVQVRAVLRQHSTHSFTIASNGSNGSNAGSVAVSYTVCR